MVVSSTNKSLTPLEGTLFQIITLFLSVVWGAQYAARQPQPHARSAFRRVMSLYNSLARIRVHIQAAPSIYQIDGEAKLALHMLDKIVEEQISTATDAVADWQDMLDKAEIDAILHPPQLALPEPEAPNAQN